MNCDERLAVEAGFWGGWAPVCLAVANGMLPAQLVGVEGRPGNRGFQGGHGSDRHDVETYSALADSANLGGFSKKRRLLAVWTLEPRMDIVVDLVTEMAMCILLAERLRSALSD